MEKKIKSGFNYQDIILIPTDFSEVCENAMDHAAELAQFLKYKVLVLHVKSAHADSKTKKTKPAETPVEELLAKSLERLEKKYKIKTESLLREGNLFEVINQVAFDAKISLMVLGTHGKQGLQHLFGSYALKVVLDSPCPVVVVQKRSFGKGYRNIVLPVNVDTEPRQTVEWVLRMNRIFKSKIHLYQAFETDPALVTKLRIITSQISNFFDDHAIPYSVNQAEKTKDYSSQLISYAVVGKSDLIMIMTMPSTDLPGFNFSKWNERLMFNEAQIPVMCINPVELGRSYYDWMTLT